MPDRNGMPIRPDLAAALNQQVNMELAASHLYLAMAARFESMNLPGFAHWMRGQSDEERGHARRLFEYLTDRGHEVTLTGVAAPALPDRDVRALVEAVGAHEAKVTASINAIYARAVETADFATQARLDWFVTEQVEEEKQVTDILGRLDLIKAHGGSLLMIDKELAARSGE
jgi:ferritin